MKTIHVLTAAFLAATLSAGAAFANDHEVRMLNRGADGQTMVFEPAYLEIAPGDTVTFLATDLSHNAESILTIMPDGAEGFRGRINEELTITFTEEGVYGVKCLPHYGMGMVALIRVGEALPNLEAGAAVRHPSRARGRMEELFEQIDG